MVKIFLSCVGGLYVFLGIWCSLLPERASKTVGFELRPGSGESEFLTVYGGLEVALGLIFLWPWIRPAETEFALWACLVIHACLVVFRSLGLRCSTPWNPPPTNWPRANGSSSSPAPPSGGAWAKRRRTNSIARIASEGKPEIFLAGASGYVAASRFPRTYLNGPRTTDQAVWSLGAWGADPAFFSHEIPSMKDVSSLGAWGADSGGSNLGAVDSARSSGGSGRLLVEEELWS